MGLDRDTGGIQDMEEGMEIDKEEEGMEIEEEEEGEIASQNESKVRLSPYFILVHVLMLRLVYQRIGSKRVIKFCCFSLDSLTCENLDQSKK